MSYFSVYLTIYVTNYTKGGRSYAIAKAENKEQNCDICFFFYYGLRYNISLKLAVELSGTFYTSAII